MNDINNMNRTIYINNILSDKYKNILFIIYK